MFGRPREVPPCDFPDAMSIPKMKASNSDTMSESKPGLPKATSSKKIVKPTTILAVKSKIPKHEKSIMSITSSREAVTSKSQEIGNKRLLENQFNKKQGRYTILRKEIDEKEKCCMTIYKEIQELRKKMVASGGKDPVVEDQLEVPTTSLDLLTQVDNALNSVNDICIEVYRKALDKRNSKLLCWIDELQSEETITDCLKEELSERIVKVDWNVESVELSKELQDQFQRMRQNLDRLRHQLEQMKSAEETSEKVDKQDKERALKARARIRDLEKQLHELQEKIQQKDANFKLKCEELLKSQESNETARNKIAKVDKQRECQETKLAKLKQEFESKDKGSQGLINVYSKQVQQLQKELDDERNVRQELQTQFDQFKTRNEKLEEKCQQLLEMREQEKQVLSDDQHTEYEIQLYNELRELKKVILERDETIGKLEAEREKILAAVNTEDGPGKADQNSKEKLTAELVIKMDELKTLTNQFTQVQKNYKRMKERAERFEQKLTDMNRLHSQMMKDSSGSRATYGAQVIQLQQQITDLSSSLADATEQNNELEKTCTRLHLKLDCYKRHLHKYDESHKLRKEMYTLLQNKDIAMMGTDPYLDVNQTTADEIENLYDTLEKKELQVMQLEKLVKQMEAQETSLQAQRTRLENRIAKLEVDLRESQQAHRNRGFSSQ